MHALKLKKVPTVEERIEKGFDSYLKTYNFTDDHIKTLRRIKEILVANIVTHKPIRADEIFSNPVFEKIVGTRDDVQRKFEGKFEKVIEEIEELLAA